MSKTTKTKTAVKCPIDDDAMYLLKRVCRAWYDLAGKDGHYTTGNEEICLGSVASLATHMHRVGLKF